MKRISLKRKMSLMLFLGIVPVLNSFYVSAVPSVNFKKIINQYSLFQKINGQEKIYIQTDKEFYLAGENVWYKAYLVDAVRHLPSDKSKFVYTELIDEANNVVQRQKLHSDSAGFHGNLQLPEDIPSGRYQIRAFTLWMQNAPENFFFRKTISIHNPFPFKSDSVSENTKKGADKADVVEHATSQKPDVQFFPEGGHLLCNRTNVVAFKAIDASGLSIEVSGIVFDKSGSRVTEFQSAFKGMGRFSLPVEADQTYYAEVKTKDGQNYRFNLPDPVDNGVVVRGRVSSSRLVYYLDKGDACDISRCLLVIHQRGKLLRLEQIDRFPTIDTLNFNGLPDGVTHLILTDTLGNPMTQRLFFIHNNENKNQIKIDVISEPTKTVSLGFTITNNVNNAVSGNFSLSVTDASLPLGNRSHIESNMLLTSDLKGYIEESDRYFDDELPNRLEKLDNLMLTQGWTRFDAIGLIRENTLKTGRYAVEKGQILSGVVRDKKKNTPVANIPVTIMGMKSRVLEVPVTGIDGRFYVDGISFSDSTHFVFRAGEKMKVKHYIEVDQDTFPNIGIGLPTLRQEELMYARQSESLAVTEKMREVNLNQITVSYKKPKSKSYLHGSADYTADQSRLKEFPLYTLPEVLPLLYSFFQYDAVTNAVTIHDILSNEYVTPKLMVNDRYFEWDEFATYAYKTEDIESIDIIRGLVAEQLSGGSAIVVVQLNRNAQNKVKSNVQMVNLLGWHKPVDFYRPRYNYEAEREMLMPYSTIFWSPDIQVNAQGQVVVPAHIIAGKPLQIVLEGIGSKGEIIHYQGKVK